MVTTKHEFYTRHNPDRPLCTVHPDNLALRGSNGSPGIHDTELPGQSHVASDSDDEEALGPLAEADAARDDDTSAVRNFLKRPHSATVDEEEDSPGDVRNHWNGPQVEDPTILAEILQDTVDDEDPLPNDAPDSALHFSEEDILDRCGVDDDLFASASPAGSSRDDYVFPQNIASNLLVKEVAIYELRTKLEMKLTDAAFNEILRGKKFILNEQHGEPNNYPESLAACRKILGIEDVWEYSVHYCPNCYAMYSKLQRKDWRHHKNETCSTPGCDERRFECRKTNAGESVYPRKYFIYFGVEKAILSSYAEGQFPAVRAMPNARAKDDIWNGELVKRMNAHEHLGGELLQEEDVIAADGSPAKLRKCGLLDVGFDGAQIWNHKQYSMGFLVMRYWDVPFEIRGKAAFTMLLGLYPEDVKQGKMQDIFMAPFVEEMLKLGTEGMWVYDSYLQKRYESKWFLGTVSADTPARNTIGKFSGVSGYRADYRSLFEGAKFSNINSEGTYFTGYVSPVKQRMFFGDRTVLAYDASLILNHAKSLDLARRVQDGVVINGTLQKLPANVAGRHGIPPLASLSYFDLHFGYLLPWIHAGPWGILKNFWKHLLRDYTGQAPALVISKAGRKQMSERAKYLVLTSDMGRPYTDIVKYKGTWVMENWLHWAETFSPVIVHDILQQECPEALEAWMDLRNAFLHYLCSHGWYDHMTADEKEKACCDAKVSIRKYARFVEEKLGIQYCTINLRLLAVHSYDQEIQTGPIKHTLEFWVERAIQRYKKWVKDRVVNNPDIFLGQGYLLECALNVASAGERDVQKMFPRAGRVAHEDTMMDDDGQYIHLVGPGKYVKVEETFVDKLHVLEEFLRGIGRNDIAAGLQMASRPVSVHVFQRAQIELEVFHSKEYHRTTSRCSHHVCYQLKDDAPSTKRFGRVVRYYKMDAFLGTSLSSTVRFCEMDSFEVTTTPADKALGYDTVSTSSPGTKFVSLDAFRRKVIFFEPPACSDRNEARVLQCWTKGRV